MAITEVGEAVRVLRPFLPKEEFSVMTLYANRGSDKLAYQEKLLELANRIETMPITYQQDGKGDDAIVYLHYFRRGSDWYITEKDMEGGVEQAFGWACLNGDVENAGIGYISIAELTELGVELDLFFTPCPLREVKAGREHRAQALERLRNQPQVAVS